MDDLGPREAHIIRWVVRSCVAIFFAALMLYPADWVVWRLRVACGGGMDAVPVTHMTAAELKGNKEEYYPDGAETEACSLSLFPQSGNSACWWLRRHPDIIERY